MSRSSRPIVGVDVSVILVGVAVITGTVGGATNGLVLATLVVGRISPVSVGRAVPIDSVSIVDLEYLWQLLENKMIIDRNTQYHRLFFSSWALIITHVGISSRRIIVDTREGAIGKYHPVII